MTAYQRGVRLEYLARNVLRQQGYVVIRSAGSHSPIDLVGLNKHELRLIQVKKAGQSVRLALQQLNGLTAPRGTRKEIWVYQPARGHVPARWQVIEAKRRRS